MIKPHELPRQTPEAIDFDITKISKAAVRAQFCLKLMLILGLAVLIIYLSFYVRSGSSFYHPHIAWACAFLAPFLLFPMRYENPNWLMFFLYAVLVAGIFLFLASIFYGLLSGVCFLIGVAFAYSSLRLLWVLLFTRFPSHQLMSHHVWRLVRARRRKKPWIPLRERFAKGAFGVVLTYSLAMLTLVGGLYFTLTLTPALGGIFTLLASSVGTIVTVYCSAILFLLARSKTILSAEKILKYDSRAPVALLRSFGDDQTSVEFSVMPLMPWNWILSLEEVLDRVLRRYGPFLSIGDPTTGKSHEGSNRMFLSHDTWKAEASNLITQAKIIVYIPGITEGVLWELGEIMSQQQLSKTLIVFPPSNEDQDANDQRWNLVSSIFAHTQWADALARCNRQNVLLLNLKEDGKVATFSSHKTNQGQYEMATVFGLFEAFTLLERR